MANLVDLKGFCAPALLTKSNNLISRFLGQPFKNLQHAVGRTFGVDIIGQYDKTFDLSVEGSISSF